MAGFSIGNKRIGDDAPVYFVAELSARGLRAERCGEFYGGATEALVFRRTGQ